MGAGIILLEKHGPAGVGLAVQPPIPAEALVGAAPTVKAHNFFEDETFKCGVWLSTPMESRLLPYPVTELMVLLEGSVEIAEASGKTVTLNAGDAFVIGQGAPLSWRQSETVRKVYAIWPAPVGVSGLVHVDLAAPLTAMPIVDASAYDGAPPKESVAIISGGSDNGPVMGVWATTERHTHFKTAQRHEMAFLLEGEAVLTEKTGTSTSVRAGDAYIVVAGTTYRWDSVDLVKKVFCTA